MKFIICLAFSAFTSTAFACSQPPALYSQSIDLQRVLESESFKAELSKNMIGNFSTSIQSVAFENTISFNLSNGCVIESSLEFEAPEANGLCERFVGVTSRTICN